MKVAHLSDLHVLDLAGVSPLAYANKRLLGYANLRLKRNHQHRAQTAAALMREVRRADVDHVVITGDLTNLGLEPEFRAVLRMLRDELGLPPSQVSIVPGNHDTYVRDTRLLPFDRMYAEYTSSDLPEHSIALAGGRFPFVRVRGPLAIIGLSSAVPRPPFVAAGHLGGAQRRALDQILAHPSVRDKTPLVLVHHPTYAPRSSMKALLEGLHDGAELERALEGSRPAVVLHGHLHRRLVRRPSSPSRPTVIGATSASLHHHDADRMAGFNVYTFGDGGDLVDLSAQVFEAGDASFALRAIPEYVW